MAITKKILMELGLDDKKAEAVLKKFREEAKKPVKMELDIDVVSLDNAMVALNKFFTQLQKGLGKEKGFEVLSQSLIKVSENIEKVINTSKEMTAINVNPVGLDQTTEQIKEVAEALKKMTEVKPDTDFFVVVKESLERIKSLVDSICIGMNFDNIHPSPYFISQIDELTEKLGKLETAENSLDGIKKKFEQYQKTYKTTDKDTKKEVTKTVMARPNTDAAKAAREYASYGFLADYENSNSITGTKQTLAYMKDYIRMGGQLEEVSVTAKKSLADVFSAMRVDATLGGNTEIKQMIDDVVTLQQASIDLAEARKNLQVAQARENRDITATFDATSVESFSNAIKSAVSELKNLNIQIPEGTQIAAGFSEEQLKGFIQNLDAISGKLEEIHKLMQNAFDITKLQAEINEGINKTPIKINVEPELTDPAGFVSEVEKQLAGHKAKIDIVINDGVSGEEGAEKKSMSSLAEKSELITSEVARRKQAYVEAEGAISSAIQNEYTQLEILQIQINEVVEALERLLKILPEAQSAKNNGLSQLTESFAQLQESLAGIDSGKLKSLSDIFKNLPQTNDLAANLYSVAESLGTLESKLKTIKVGKNLVSELNKLASQGEALKDLAVVLKASTEQIDSAGRTVRKRQEKQNNFDVAQARKRLESTLDEKSIEGLGKFSQSDIKKNGSAILTFVDELEGKVVTTKVKVLDLNEALDKVASNKLSTKDYEILNQKSRDKKQQQTPVEEVTTIKDDEMAKINNGFSSIRNGANTSSEAIGELNKILAEQSSILAKVSSAANETAQSEKKYAEAVKEVTTASAKGLVGDFNKDYTKLENKSAGKIPEYSTQLEGMKNLINQLEAITSAEDFDIFAPGTLEQITGITTQLKTLNDELKQTKKYTSVSDSKITGLQKQMATWESKNSKALSDAKVRKQFDDLYKGLKNGIPESEFDRIQAGFNKIVSSASKAGKTGKTFFEGWKSRMTSLAQYLTTFASFYDVINVLRQGIQVIRDLDTAFVEMQKVSNDSLSSLKEFAQESFALGDSVGTTGQQMQKSAADWMRLGESLNQAKESAKTSNILLNVSEFDNIDSATESLVSMSQAYKDLDKIDIVDKLNNIGNNYSISTDGLATALQKSASALTTAGNDMDEAIALVTAGM